MQIYEAIKKYYPIGINRDSFEIFFEYDGLKKLDKIITDNI